MAAEARSIPLGSEAAEVSPQSARPAEGSSGRHSTTHGDTGARLTPLRELQLLESYRAGGPDSHRALTELLSGYQRRVYSVCYRIVRHPEDAADLTQDVLLKVVDQLATYDGRSKLSTWIIRVAMNATLSHLRKAKTRKSQSLDAPPVVGRSGRQDDSPARRTGADLPGREPSPDRRVELLQRDAMVARALDSLDVDTRAILVLRDMQDLDYQQIAEVLDAPLGTIKSRLFRARAAFRHAFESLEAASNPPPDLSSSAR